LNSTTIKILELSTDQLHYCEKDQLYYQHKNFLSFQIKEIIPNIQLTDTINNTELFHFSDYCINSDNTTSCWIYKSHNHPEIKIIIFID